MPSVDFSTCNIIVIDDETLIRQFLALFLKGLGIQNTFQAENGHKGLELVSSKGAMTDLIICDLSMPEMDGFDFVANLRADQDPNIAAIPVLILTGHIEQENVEKAVTLGIHGYLRKPIDKVALEKRMIRALTAPPIDVKRLKR
jgi:YesN/AraC family two-component response regulator